MSTEKEPAAALECGPEPVHVVLHWYGSGELPPRRIALEVNRMLWTPRS